ncbi:MAG: ABC transporter permease [Candidatus Latescibacteria bacterium]|nr:ABC transporter permease [Candidatus Latescibacterota bacterium]
MQKTFEGMLIALSALWANKLRSFLTLLCVIISIMAIIAVVSIIDGMNTYVREEIATQGSDVFVIQRVNELGVLTNFDLFIKSLRYPRLTLDDADAIRREVPQAKYVDAAVETQRRVYAGQRYVDNASIRGRTSEYPIIGDWPLDHGRHLAPIDVNLRKQVCVVGWDVALNLFPAEDPVGRWIKIGGRHYQVIGVVKKKSSILGENQNLFAFVPVTAFLKHFGWRRSVNISVKTGEMETVPEAMEEARAVMRVRHRLRPGQEDNFHITTSEALLSLWRSISQGIFSALIGLVSITLVIGGIIIMNIMLVAVTERTREIGIRKALGAQRRDILLQFLVESVTLSTVGGVAGIVSGFGAAFLIASFTPMPYAVKGWSIGIALVIVFTVGIFFGLYPANKAAKLHPVDALRYE